MSRLIFTGLPAGEPITGRFGQWYTRSDGTRYQHRGVDHGLNGAPIYSRSIRPARVVVFTNDGSFGVAVCLQHDHDGQALYELNAHMSRRLVNVGDLVQPGQVIGYVGATGTVTGPHCHWDLCYSSTFPVDISQHLDPLTFIGEEEEMDARIRYLMRVAAGDFGRMETAYRALVGAGLAANDIPSLAYDGSWQPDGNSAITMRLRIIEIAMADNYAQAYAAITGGTV